MNQQAPLYYYYYPQNSYPSQNNYYSSRYLPFNPSPSSYYPSYNQSYSTYYRPIVQSRVITGPPLKYSEVLAKTTCADTREEEAGEQEIVEKLTSKTLFAEEELSTEFQKSLSKFVRNNQGKFCDIEFPPNFKSLVGENADKKPEWTSFCWLRPEEFMDYTKPIQPIVGKIEPNDIKQGNLNDSYLLSTLASIAEHPQRIRNLLSFQYPDKSEDEVIALCKKHGIYCVRLYEMGVPVEIVIDDMFPTLPKENFITAFSRTLENELWSLLIEKAWAKSYNSYADIEWGWTRHSLHDFIGAPTKVVWTDEDSIWEAILKGEQKDWIMTTGAFDSNIGEDITKEGIVTAQSYSLLSAIEFEDQEFGKVRLVKLRDPHGIREWNGKWSDGSPEYEKIPEKYKEEGRNEKDGIFFMNLEDFKKNFENSQFCLVDDSFKYSYLQTKISKKEGVFFQVKVPTKGRYFFTILQRNQKKYPKKLQENFDYARVTMVIAKKTGEDYDYIKGVFRSNYEVWTCKGEEESIDEGEYIVFVKCKWVLAEEDELTLSVYGSDTVEITQIQKQTAFLDKIYLDYAKKNCKNVKLVEGIENCFIKEEITNDGYAFVSVHNENKEKKVNCELKFINLKENKLKIKGKEHEEGKKKFVLEPNSEKIVLLRMEDYANEKTQFYEANIISE